MKIDSFTIFLHKLSKKVKKKKKNKEKNALWVGVYSSKKKYKGLPDDVIWRTIGGKRVPISPSTGKPVERSGSGENIPSANKGGDCYQASYNYVLDNPKAVLVQGEVTGQGAIKGIKYGHSWVEVGNTVIDKSGSRNIKMSKDTYYKLGNITRVKKYKTNEVLKNVV